MKLHGLVGQAASFSPFSLVKIPREVKDCNNPVLDEQEAILIADVMGILCLEWSASRGEGWGCAAIP